jgi:hypothetical protein
MIHGTRCGEIIDCEDDSYQHTILVPHSEIASTITHERHGSMIDSGANRSMVKEFIKLINPQHTHHEIEVASGKSIPTDWSGHHGDIPETIHFPDLKYDIYSVKSLTALGYGILFEGNDVFARNAAKGMPDFTRIGTYAPELGFVWTIPSFAGINFDTNPNIFTDGKVHNVPMNA